MIALLETAGVTYDADPGHTQPNEINQLIGGRGAYFDDADGHNMDIMTRPYVWPWACLRRRHSVRRINVI